MTLLDAFPPIVDKSARVLILGSMPSTTSLARQQYYGHPRNAFWRIMAELVGAGPELDYRRRQQMLIEHGIAVWDVLQSCARPGSLDSNIDMSSIKINDFERFFDENRSIRQVFFNGGTAEKLFKQRVLPGLTDRFDYLSYRRLPSTSPAHAGMTLARKIELWQEALSTAIGSS
ncbi:MAG: DNA-deoxyinosine glycosylase [Gammaproteobacteria bacterium]